MTQTFTKILVISVTLGSVFLSKNSTADENTTVSLGSSISTSLHGFDDNRKRTSSNFDIRPSFTLKNGLSVSTSLNVTKNLENERELTLNDSYISLGKKLYSLDNGLSLSASMVFGLPISKYSRNDSTLRTSVKVSPRLSYSYKKLSSGLGLSYRQNFHASEVTVSGDSNTQSAYTTYGDIGYGLSDQISIGASASYTKSYTYRKNERDSYSIEQNISYSPNANLSFSFGHAIGGNVLSVNGRDSNIEIFDPENSSVYLGLRFIHR
ncbi:MAG: hypothetical protein ACO2ZP_01555 [Bacteriovoracaceae bacterium]